VPVLGRIENQTAIPRNNHRMPLYKVALLSFVALATMVNPLAVAPSFIALTDGASRRTRASVAFVAGVSSASPCRRFRSWVACFS
jgi:hypothetical protein